MKSLRILKLSIVIAVAVFAIQSLFISFLPNLIFQIAKHRSAQPPNTVIHAPRTNADLRRVVLPNPDFIYSACFFDVSKTDLVITGSFPDTNQYCSLSFYGSDVQPFYVMNNLQGRKKNYRIRLSSVNRVQGTLRAVSAQGSVLMRVLAIDSEQIQNALRLQQQFEVKSVVQTD